MKTAILALDATRDSREAIDNIVQGVIRFQQAGLFDDLHVVTVIHPHSYMVPHEFYREEKYTLANKTKNELKSSLDARLRYRSIETLVTDEQTLDDHVSLLGHFAQDVGADAVIVGSAGKSTLSYLVEGSFAELASIKSSRPVLVIGEAAGFAHVKQPASILVAFSPKYPPTSGMRKWLDDLAVGLKAKITYRPLDGRILSWDQVPWIADSEQALVTVLCSTPDTEKRSFFSGSQNGRVIAEMGRPIFILKEAPAKSAVTLLQA